MCKRIFQAALVLLASAAGAILPGAAVEQVEPDNSGPVKLMCASWLGGPGHDELVGAAISPDMKVILAGNGSRYQPAGVTPVQLNTGDLLAAVNSMARKVLNKRAAAGDQGNTSGFVARLSLDGKKVLSYARLPEGTTIRKMVLDARGTVYLLCSAGQGSSIGQEIHVAVLPPGANKLSRWIHYPDTIDFAVDGNGDILTLTNDRLSRWNNEGTASKWSVQWRCYGEKYTGAMTVSPQTGIAAVVGYGAANTGHEPYKDPFAFAFDRAGKQVWALWNPDPKRERPTELGGNGLMADTSGNLAAVDRSGNLLLGYFADGGNTIMMRDPRDPARPLAASVLDGVFQNTPGYGFVGAAKTSVLFRVEPKTGRLDKGTWLSSWINPRRANSLQISAVDTDEDARTFVVGRSYAGCPTRQPWYTCMPNGYRGGGYLAVFDRGFRMVQCGYFPTSDISAVGARNGYLVIAGSARDYEDKAKQVPARTFNPPQASYGGGDRDGYFAIFRLPAAR